MAFGPFPWELQSQLQGPTAPTQAPKPPISPEVKSAVDTLLGLWGTSNSKGSHQRVLRDFSDAADSVPVDPSSASDADRLKYAMQILEAGQSAKTQFSDKGLNAWKSAVSPLMSAYAPAAKFQWISTSTPDDPGYGQWAQYASQLGFNGPIYSDQWVDSPVSFDEYGNTIGGGGGVQKVLSPEFRAFVDNARAQGYDFVQNADNIVNFNQRYGFRLPSGEVVAQTSIRGDQDVRDFGMSLLPIASMMLGVPGIGGPLTQAIGSAILPEATAAAIGSAIGASASTVTSALGQAAIQSGLTALGGGDAEDILRAGALPIAAPVVSGLVGRGLGAVSPPDFDPSLGQLAQPMQDAVQKAITAGTLAEIKGGNFTDAALTALATPVAQAVVPSGLGALEKPAESALASGALAAIRGQDPVDAALTSAAGSAISATVPKELGLLERPLEQALATAAGTAIAGGDVETRFRQALSSAMAGATAEQIGKDFGLSAATSRVILDAAMSGGDFNKMFNAMVATSKDLGKPTRVADAGGVDLNDIYADTSPAGLGGAGSAADSAGTLVAGPMDFSAPSKAAEKSQLADYIRQQAASGASGFRVGPGGVLEVEDVDRGLVHRFTSDGSALGSSETVFASRSGSPLATSAAVKDFLAAPYVQSLFEGGAGAGDGAGRYLVPEVTGDGVGSPEAGTSYSPEQAAQWDREAAEEQASNELEQVNPPVILPTDVDTTGDYGQSVFDEIDRSAAEQDPVTQQRLNEMDQQFYMPTQLDFQQPAGLSESQVRQIVAETLAANPSLTAQQVQQIVDSAVQSMPPGLTLQDVSGVVDSAISRLPKAPTTADIDAAIGRATAGMATRADVEQAVRGIQFPEGINQEDVTRAISDYMAQNPGLTAADVAQQVEQQLRQLPTYATPEDVRSTVRSVVADVATKADVQRAIAGIQFPAGLSEADVSRVITDYMRQNPGLSAQDVAQQVGDQLRQLPAYATPADVESAIQGAMTNVATRADVEKAIQGIQFPTGISRADVTDVITDYMRQNPGLSAAEVTSLVGEQLSRLPAFATPQDVESTVRGALAGYATSEDVAGLGRGLEAVRGDLTQLIADAQASGLRGDAALRASLDALAGDLGTTRAALLAQLGTSEQALRSDFASQLGGVQSQVTQLGSSLSDAIAEARASGLQGDAALQAGLTSLAGELGTTKEGLLSQLGQTEEALRSQFQTAIGGLETGLTGQIGGLRQEVQEQYDMLSAAQQAEVARRVQQGEDLNRAISDVQTSLAGTIGQVETGLTGQIGGLRQEVQEQYDMLSERQQAEVAQRVQQGQDLTKAIQDVQSGLAGTIAGVETGLTGQIGGLRQDVAEQFQMLSDAQQAEVQRRISQGENLEAAINAVSSGLGERLTGLETGLTQKIGGIDERLNARIDELMKDGATFQTATNQALSEVTGGLRSLSQQQEEQTRSTQESIGGVQESLNARIDQLMQQGVDWQEAANQAISELSQKTESSISGLGLDIQSQIEEMQRRSIDAQTASDLATLDYLERMAIRQQESEAAAIAERAAAEERAAQRAAQAAAQSAEESRRSRLMGLASSFASQQASQAAAADPYKATFLAPYIVGGTAPEKFEGPLSGFLKQAMTGDFLPDKPQEQPRQSVDQQMGADQFFSGTNPLDMYQPEQEYQGLFGFRAGGMVPFMAQGGTRYGHNAHGALRVLEHSGKHRVDYRQGDAVTGIGDGQSDDIPAMLADGEFVIPADVVAALGNGSTKAGSDKLYEMMHNIRRHHRSTGPKDLPPPAKAPLEYIKSRKGRSA